MAPGATSRDFFWIYVFRSQSRLKSDTCRVNVLGCDRGWIAFYLLLALPPLPPLPLLMHPSYPCPNGRLLWSRICAGELSTTASMRIFSQGRRVGTHVHQAPKSHKRLHQLISQGRVQIHLKEHQQNFWTGIRNTYWNCTTGMEQTCDTQWSTLERQDAVRRQDRDGDSPSCAWPVQWEWASMFLSLQVDELVVVKGH